MAQLLVRNLDEEVVESLRAAAREHGRSLEAEVRAILGSAAADRLGMARKARWIARLKEIQAGYGDYVFSDSTGLIRQDRDSR